MSFDPNATAAGDSGIFGLPFSGDEARLHLIAVPWEVTTSYGSGAARGPDAILRASHQVDLFDIETGEAWENGYFLRDTSAEIAFLNSSLKTKAQRVVEALERGDQQSAEITRLIDEVNLGSEKLNAWVYGEAKEILAAGKIPGLIGGDHSSPYGLLQAISEATNGEFGILHIDAHADLREAYQGFTHSHASIMFNVMSKLAPKQLVQVGVRDFSRGEFAYIQQNAERIHSYYDAVYKRRLARGDSWQLIASEIIALLPDNVYVSFDIDGLSPDLCPNTGTPVPGGLSFDQALILFSTLAESGRRIIGFDLNEVATPDASLESDAWDANVGARLLFKLCGWTMVSQGLAKVPRR